MKRLFLATTFLLALALPGIAMEEMKHQMDTLETKADGFDLSLDIMTHKDYQKMMKGMKMDFMKPTAGTTHHIALSIRKDNKSVEEAAVNMKVVSPDKKEESHLLSFNTDAMNQYVGHFNMQKKGKYQLSITFETVKEKHQGIVNYEIK